MRQPLPDSRTSASTELFAAGFLEQVQNALEHLHDPTYLQTHPLARLALARTATASSAGKALKQSLEEAIDSLKPATAKVTASSSRGHEILRLRYLEALDVRTILARLALGRSEYYRDHRRAVEAAVEVLRERWGLAESIVPELGQVETTAFAANRARDQQHMAGPPNNLPLQLTSFVGREREIDEVRALLGQHRLVTLTGSGGCGKTRLALEVARELLDRQRDGDLDSYPDGVWLVELAALADPDLVVQSVATSLGVRPEAGQPLSTTLLAALKPRDLLLVLDNCEHLVDSCAELADLLLRACSDLRILATSRQALGIAGDRAYRVPSLSVPDAQWPVEDLTQYESVRLFVERAAAHSAGFALTSQNMPAVAEICSRLDGIPLAIELAAARLSALSVEQVLSRLGDRFRLLTGGSRAALPRQQTLRAAIDWSHYLLSDAERALFRRLAVFAGGWTLDAAEETCQDGEVAKGDVLDLLSHLVDKSLALVEPGTGEVRYRLLATIQEYARERLEESGEVESARTRHRDHYLALAERASASIWVTSDQRLWIDRLEADHDNLRSALRCCQEVDPSAFLRLAASLYKFWDTKGYTAEGLRWVEEALLAAPEHTAVRAEALCGAGFLASDEGDGVGARARWEEYLALCRELGDRRGEGNALVSLGKHASDDGDHERALEYLEESVTLLRQVGGASETAWALETLGNVIACALGDYPRARAYLEESVSILARARGRMTNSLAGLGRVYLCEGDYEQARRHLEASLAAAIEEGDEPSRGQVLATLGDLARLSGDRALARARLGDALGILKAIGHRQRLGRAIAVSALLAADERLFVRVARLVGSATATHQRFTALMLLPEIRSLDAVLAAAEAALGKEDFARAWAGGQAMTVDQAVDYALAAE